MDKEKLIESIKEQIERIEIAIDRLTLIEKRAVNIDDVKIGLYSSEAFKKLIIAKDCLEDTLRKLKKENENTLS